MNEFHQSIFSIGEIDETDLRNLRKRFQSSERKVSDQDLSLAVLALQKTLETTRDCVIITDDENFISFLMELRNQEQINLSFGRAKCSKLAFRRLTEYVTEIYHCCKMEKEEYEPIYFGLYRIYDKRTDLTDPQKKKLKRTAFDRFTRRFTKTTIEKYPDL